MESDSDEPGMQYLTTSFTSADPNLQPDDAEDDSPVPSNGVERFDYGPAKEVTSLKGKHKVVQYDSVSEICLAEIPFDSHSNTSLSNSRCSTQATSTSSSSIATWNLPEQGTTSALGAGSASARTPTCLRLCGSL